MLSTFFSTSRPFHYLTVFLWIAIVTCLFTLLQANIEWLRLSAILIIALSLGVYEFIVSKNYLTPQSTYALWIAAGLTLLFLKFNVSLEVLLAQLFILLSLRRLLSLKNDHSTVKKLFDASFWVTIATLFFHWSALFYIVIMVAIFLYVRNDYRNWLVPFMALGAVWILLFTYDYVWNKQVLFDVWNSFELSYLWQQLNFSGVEILLLLLLLIAALGLIIYLIKLTDLQQSVRPRFTVMTLSGICAISIAILDFKSFAAGGFLLLIPAVALFIARMVHLINHKTVVELLLWFPLILIGLSFLLP